MTKQIHYTQTVNFLGRNGRFKAIGLVVSSDTNDDVHLMPVTSKDTIGRSEITVPRGSIPELIDTLKLFLKL
jgi:hypothetical protein